MKRKVLTDFQIYSSVPLKIALLISENKEKKNNVYNDLSTVKRVKMQIFQTFALEKSLSQQCRLVKSKTGKT